MPKKRWAYFSVAAIVVVLVGAFLLRPSLRYEYQNKILPKTFEPYYEFKKRESKMFAAIDGTQEKLLRFAPKTEIAILYIHGFGANRKEGEGFTDKIAEKYQYNTYYLRLPGHGTNKEDHAKRSFQEYINEAEDALHMVQLLGENVVIFATSMGANIATYLAAKYANTLVKAVVLFSPFYDFADKTAKVLDFPGGAFLANIIAGRLRNTDTDPTAVYVKDGYRHYNYSQQYTSALVSLNNMRNFLEAQNLYHKVSVPVLMFYYYKDEKNQDKAADVKAMKKVFSKLGKNPLHQLVEVNRGSHILTSEYIDSDKALLEQKVDEFFLPLKQTLSLSPKPLNQNH